MPEGDHRKTTDLFCRERLYAECYSRDTRLRCVAAHPCNALGPGGGGVSRYICSRIGALQHWPHTQGTTLRVFAVAQKKRKGLAFGRSDFSPRWHTERGLHRAGAAVAVSARLVIPYVPVRAGLGEWALGELARGRIFDCDTVLCLHTFIH